MAGAGRREVFAEGGIAAIIALAETSKYRHLVGAALAQHIDDTENHGTGYHHADTGTGRPGGTMSPRRRPPLTTRKPVERAGAGR